MSVSGEDRFLFSRYQHGARPVRVLVDGWEVLKDGRPTKFTTAQGLLAELTGHPTGRHWSLDRYFGLGPYAAKTRVGNSKTRVAVSSSQLLGQADVLDLFQVESPTSRKALLLEPLAPPILAFRQSDPGITVSPIQTRNVVSPVLAVSGPIGIDLSKRCTEVRKLLFAGFGRKIFQAGYDPEDVLQEVFRGILARNHGSCPWDPAKSSFGHYVHMVCSCVLSNYHRKQKRVRQFEQSGLPSYEEGLYEVRDAASSNSEAASPCVEQTLCLMGEEVEDLIAYMRSHGDKESRLAVEVLPYVTAGTPRHDIAKSLGTNLAAISRAVSYLRARALEWARGT